MMLMGRDLRLTAHGERCASRKFLVDGADLLGNMSEGLVEKLESLILDLFELILGSFGPSSSIFEFFFCSLESALDSFQALNRSHIGSHLFEVVIESGNFGLKLVVQAMVRLLILLAEIESKVTRTSLRSSSSSLKSTAMP